MTSIFDKYLSLNDCGYYIKRTADVLGLQTYCYYWDNKNKIKIPSEKNIHTWSDFRYMEAWRITFNLSKPKTIAKVGLEQYVSKHHELVFKLNMPHYSIVYVAKFYKPKTE